jgi:hypothetical protein
MREAIRKASQVIVEELLEYSNSEISYLDQDAPQTTPSPSNIEVMLGLPRYEKAGTSKNTRERLSYNQLIAGLLSYYLEYQLERSIESPVPEIKNTMEDSPLFTWESTLLSQLNGGVYWGKNQPGRNRVWLSFLPSNIVSKLERDIYKVLSNERINEKEAELIASFPEFWIGHMGHRHRGNIGRQRYLSTLAHELTHFYLEKNTHIGALKSKTNIEGNSGGVLSRAKSILGQSEGLSRVEQAKAVGSGDYIQAIDEIGGHFVGFEYYRNEKDFSGYDEPELIEWGVKILEQKVSEVDGSPIDWVRKMEVNVMTEVAKKGQIRNNGESRNPAIYFLKHCLPEKDKRRLTKFREIAENDLSKSFKDLRRAVSDLEEYEQDTDQKIFRDLKKLEQSIDWENPAHIEDYILHDILNKAVGNYDLDRLHQEIMSALEREIEKLQQIMELLKKVDSEVSDVDAAKEIEEAGSEILNTEEEINSLI